MIAHAGYLVDPQTGEVLRELQTGRYCRGCGVPVQRRGKTGRHRERCEPCGKDHDTIERRREAARDSRIKREIKRDRAVDPDLWVYRNASRNAYALPWAIDADDDRRSGKVRSPKRFELHQALSAQPGERKPLVLDYGIDGHLRPPGWYAPSGPDVGRTAASGDLADELDAHHDEVSRHWWWDENYDWREFLDDDTPSDLHFRKTHRDAEVAGPRQRGARALPSPSLTRAAA